MNYFNKTLITTSIRNTTTPKISWIHRKSLSIIIFTKILIEALIIKL
jgi:hypothetical protein